MQNEIMRRVAGGLRRLARGHRRIARQDAKLPRTLHPDTALRSAWSPRLCRRFSFALSR